MNPRQSAATAALAAGRMVAGLAPSDESPAHFALSARTRRGRIAQLRRHVRRWGARANPLWARRLELLLLERGRFARRARRARVHGIGTTVKAIKCGRSAPPPRRYAGVSASSRVAHADRVLLLQQEGRPVSGRQWRKLRKAARRQERAA